MTDLYDLAFAKAVSGGGESPAPTPTLITKTITANGNYNAASDNADGYSSVTVDLPQEKWLKSHGSEYIVIPKEDLNMTSFKTKVCAKFKIENNELAVGEDTGLFGRWIGGLDFNLRYMIENGYQSLKIYSSNRSMSIGSIDDNDFGATMYIRMGYGAKCIWASFNKNTDEFVKFADLSYTYNTTPDIRNLDIPVFTIFNADDTVFGKPIKSEIAYFKIYDDNVLKFSGTPAINPATNKACLYDSVNNKYYGNVNAESQTDFEIIEE